MTSDNDLDVLGLVRRALNCSYEATGALVIPTILLDRAQLGKADEQRRGARLADLILGFFRYFGFYGERSRVAGHGYGDVIKEIQEWYPDDADAIRSRSERELDELDRSGEIFDPGFRRLARMLLEERLVLRQIMRLIHAIL